MPELSELPDEGEEPGQRRPQEILPWRAEQRPQKQGLYDPKYEHDACGIGFVVDVKGRPSNKILRHGLTILCNMAHRGATGSEANTGDGAGILLQLPDGFFRQVSAPAGIQLPPAGHYGAGMVFLPQEAGRRKAVEERLTALVEAEGQRLLGWRDVPTDNSSLGEGARVGEPVIRHCDVPERHCRGNLRGVIVIHDACKAQISMALREMFF